MTSERAQGTRETVPCETPDPDTRSLPQSDATRYPHPMPTEATSRNKTHPHRSAHRGNETDAHAHAAKIPIRNAPRGMGIVSPFLEQCDLRIWPARIVETRRMRTPYPHARLAGWGLFRHFWNNVIFVSARPHRLLPPDGILRLPRAAVEGKKVRRLLGRQGSGAQTEAGPTLW